jgi:hypothetical protein
MEKRNTNIPTEKEGIMKFSPASPGSRPERG